MSLRISPSITLDDDELAERFVRAQGPGGQNVNKVSTAVELRFDVDASPNLPPRVKARLRRLAGRRLTAEGVLVLFADRYRSQARNREDVRDRLVELIREAAAPPPPPRIATKPTRASKERRLAAKKSRGDVKSKRGRVLRDD
ncbi:MAG: alternative ribosome rescue aminoacyl-tRNA hydrolase ArfB [Pseudomonadota bacterium]